jgi:hypothetical protein
MLLVAFSVNGADPMLSTVGEQIRRPVVEVHDQVIAPPGPPGPITMTMV